MIQLLLDANISWRLMANLKKHFNNCLHVDHVWLKTPATDIEIWNYALHNNLIIVTNDEDFLNMANFKGFPPKVILLKTGNQSNIFIEMILLKHKMDIESLCQSAEYGLLEVY